MGKIIPYFEIDGTKYELKRTQWLVAEYNKLNNESGITEEDKSATIKANNLISDAKKFADKENELWETLCEEPTPENKSAYLMFKEMRDEAIQKYNDFVANNPSLEKAAKNNINVLEKIAIKSISEQYFGLDENKGKEIWEKYVDSIGSHRKIQEWLYAMSDCLFGEEEEENNDFLSQKRKADMERENNRKNALKKKR